MAQPVLRAGLKGLRDLPRPGAPRRYDHDQRLEVFKTACSDPPEGETHRTIRSLAETVGIGKSQTHAFLSEADLGPHQVRWWLTSLHPQFDTKQADVCGLYLAPPENAIVVSLDEKTRSKREPIRQELPLRPGKPARREFEYKRHGVQALLAALLVHTGEVIGNVSNRNTQIEFLEFLDQLETQIPAHREIHAIFDNLQHLHPARRRHRRLQLAPGRGQVHGGAAGGPGPQASRALRQTVQPRLDRPPLAPKASESGAASASAIEGDRACTESLGSWRSEADHGIGSPRPDSSGGRAPEATPTVRR